MYYFYIYAYIISGKVTNIGNLNLRILENYANFLKILRCSNQLSNSFTTAKIFFSKNYLETFRFKFENYCVSFDFLKKKKKYESL